MYTGNTAIQTIKLIYGAGLANSSSCQQCQGLWKELPGWEKPVTWVDGHDAALQLDQPSFRVDFSSSKK